MDCKSALSKLYDYIDGEIGPREREAISAHLTDCRECFSAFESESIFREFVIQRVPRPEARVAFKTHLLARLASERKTLPFVLPLPTNVISLFKRYAVAAVVLLGLGVGAAWMNRQLGNDNAAWASLAYIHHDKSDSTEIGVDTEDYAQARQFLNSQMGSEMMSVLPDTIPVGVSPHRSAVVSWNQCKVAHLAYNAGQAGHVSMFLVPVNSFPLNNEPRVHVGNRVYRSVKLGCCRALLWQNQGGYVYVLLGDCNASNLLAQAEAWHSVASQSHAQTKP